MASFNKSIKGTTILIGIDRARYICNFDFWWKLLFEIPGLPCYCCYSYYSRARIYRVYTVKNYKPNCATTLFAQSKITVSLGAD